MIFHIAIPCKDIEEAERFYVACGATVGRKYESNIILNFFEIQLVCHLSKEWDQFPKMYPRHFGIIFEDEFCFKQVWHKFKGSSYMWRKKFVRYGSEPGAHTSFFLKDPSNNLIEFKWYMNKDMIFGVSSLMGKL